jgi:phosphoribosylformylglycinamidine (FGAM) synthase PurS component
MRIQVWAHPKIGDGRADLLLTRLRTNGIGVAELRLADVYFVHQVPDLTHSHAQRLFCDPVAQQINIDEDTSPEFFDEEWSHVVEVTYRPGVANPVATSIRDALTAEFGALPEEASIQTATQYFVRCDDDSDPAVVAEALHNSLIQKSTLITREGWDAGERPPERYPTVSPGPAG